MKDSRPGASRFDGARLLARTDGEVQNPTSSEIERCGVAQVADERFRIPPERVLRGSLRPDVRCGLQTRLAEQWD